MLNPLRSADAQQAQMRWNDRYQQSTSSPQPCRVLQDNQHLLPSSGKALDLACGLGGNAYLLATKGLETWAWDISDVAISQVRQTAQQRGLTIHTEVRDAVSDPPAPASFDVIVVSRFLDRQLRAALIAALKTDGCLYYQTFIKQAPDDIGPKEDRFRLDSQELLNMFRSLRTLVYREEAQVGDLTRGWRNEALLVGQKGTEHYG
ncbi:SAM-dependent methyltransferase [Candidatus Entotheonella serta]|nr:SAM-dependent methyltransferase [Candidatus Entotheonella serta]